MNLLENLDKLPKWAQQEVQTLQMRLDESRKEVDRMNANEPSNTVVGWENNFDGRPSVYLAQNQLITFKLKNGNVQVRVKDDYLEVHSSGDGDFLVKPQAANAIKIILPQL